MSPHPVSLAQAETTKKLIAGIWRRHRVQVLARLELLECAATAVSDGSLSPALLQEALSVSHNLAGSLGMFGFGEGTQLARELERQLESSLPNAGTMLNSTCRLRVVLFPDVPVGSSGLVASN